MLIFALVFLAVVSVSLTLLWKPVFRWTAQRIIVPQVEAKMGGKIQWKELEFSLFPPEVTVEDLKVEMEKGPLRMVAVHRIAVRPGAGPIFLGRIVIEHVEIDQPFLHIVPNVQGKHAPPSPAEPRRILPSLEDLLRFEIRGLEVRDAGLRVELPGEGLQIQIGSGNAKFTGKGQEERWAWEGDGILFREGRSFRMDQVSIVAIRRGSEVWLEKFRLQGAGAEVQLKGKAYPSADLQCLARAGLNPLENALDELEMTTAPMNLEGRVEVSAKVTGDWADPQAQGKLTYEDVALGKRFFGHGELSFLARKDRLKHLEGILKLPEASLHVKVGELTPKHPASFEVKARHASYRTIRTISHPYSKPAVDGWVDLDIRGIAGIQPFVLAADYQIRSDRLTLNVGEVMSPYLPFEFKSVTVSGNVGWTEERNFFLDKGEIRMAGGRGSFQFDFPQSGRALAVWQAEVEDLGSLFPAGDAITGMGRMSGGLDVQGDVFSARLDMDISPLRYGDRPPLRFEGEVVFHEKGTRLKQMQLTSDSGNLRLDGEMNDDPNGSMQLSVAWADFDLGWMSAVGSRRYSFLKAMDGITDGSLLLTGSANHPEGRFMIHSTPFSWREKSFNDVNLILNMSPEAWNLEKGDLQWEDGSIHAQGTLGPTSFEGFDVDVKGLPVSLIQVPTWISSYIDRISGHVTLNGNLDNPSARADFSLHAVRVDESEKSTGKMSTVGPLSDLAWSVNWGQETLKAEGNVDLLHGTDFLADIEFADFSLEPLLPQVRSHLSGKAVLKGDMQQPASWNGRLDLQTLRLEQGEWFIEPTAETQVGVKNGVMTLPLTQFHGPSTNFRVEGVIWPDRRVDGKAEGELALQILSLLNMDINRAEGAADVSLKMTGSILAPNLNGDLKIRHGLLQLKDLPHAVEDLYLDATLDQKRIFVDEVKARFAEGQIFGKGSVQLSPTGEKTNVYMDFRVDHVFLRVPVWLPSEISGNLSLVGALDRPTLQGDVLVHRATYREQWDWKSRILTMGGGRRIGRVFGSDEEHLLFNVRIRSEGNSVFVRNDIATATLRADLRLTGSDLAYGLQGRLEIIEGEVLFLDNRFDLVAGTVSFISDQSIKTNVDVNARTRVLDTDIFLDLRSEGNDVQAFLSSQPTKDETNIVAMLTLGVDSDELLQAGASNQDLSSSLLPTVLSGPIQSRLESGLKKAKLVDTFQFVPYFSETTRSTGLKMIVGKKVLPTTQLLYSTDLFEFGAENTIRVEQRLNRNFSMQGSLRENRPEDENEYDLGVDFEFGFEF